MENDNNITINQELMFGGLSPSALGMTFQLVNGMAVEACFTGSNHFQGYKGILHGGVISTLLDSAMAQCLLLQDVKAVTADLRVRFLHEIPCTSKVIVKAWITYAVSTLYELKAEARVDGQLMARAKAKFMAKEENGGYEELEGDM